MANYTQTSNHRDFDDVIDWSEGGSLPQGDFDPLWANPFFSAANNRIDISHTVDDGEGGLIEKLRRLYQTSDGGSTNFRGSFAPHAKLVSTVEGRDDGPLTLMFDTPVAGVGARISLSPSQSFTGILRVYESTKRDAVPVAEYTVSGTGGFTPTETAPFLGAISDQANIVCAEFDTAQDCDFGFVIDSLRLLTTPTTQHSRARSTRKTRRNGR